MNLAFFVRHDSNPPLKIKTHFDALGAPRADPLTNVADAIRAVKQTLAPRFDATPSDQLSLHLPATIPRPSSGLSAACFLFEESDADSTLDPGCALAALLALGVSSKTPLRVVVKSSNNRECVCVVDGFVCSNFVKAAAMDVDLIDNVTIAAALEQLSALVQPDGGLDEQKNIFNAQESMETVNQPAKVLTLDVHTIGGITDLLYSHQIYVDETALGIKMPVDELLNVTHYTIVLIGVSGCGKTRTCFDYARRRWCLYFDCTKDADILSMFEILRLSEPTIKTDASQNTFEDLSKNLIKALISARLLVLRILLARTPNCEQFDWLCIQRSRRTRELFELIFSQLSEYSSRIVAGIFNKLKRKFNGRVIFDESQHLLTILEWGYRSSKPNDRGISNNRLNSPRSLFSFTAGCIMTLGLKSIWCGTHMRIRNMELIYSAGGDKPTVIHLFTNFTYLTPAVIFNLCSRWIQKDVFIQNHSLFEEASNFLQGRPRFFISFLHKLIKSDNIRACFDTYRRRMTTNHDTALSSSAPYFFWRDHIDLSVEPLQRSTNAFAFQKRLVSDVLLKLCVDFLFGDGKCISFSPDLDMVSTCLVMVHLETDTWESSMAEPLVLCAGLNYLADQAPDALTDYFAGQLFAPLSPANITPQERSHRMELVIALRFMQGWWQEPELKAMLPKWVNDMNISKPVGIQDCRRTENAGVMFVQQLGNPSFPYILLPAVNAGPDLRYSIFSCCDKTTSTRNSKSSMYVSVEEAQKNLATMYPANWYKTQASLHARCSDELINCRFVHMRFELPDTAPSMKAGFKSVEVGNDFVICVNLESDFAWKFFGTKFVASYNQFVQRMIKG
ncbi:hypothetical protein BDR26DRAFT_196928 [Obelidium mucronatum]|nr:hypothetical protein BDR26DRAFT_196928 [Obelidium mucronatum]